MEKEGETEKNASTDSFPTWLRQPWLGQTEAKSLEFHLDVAGRLPAAFPDTQKEAELEAEQLGFEPMPPEVMPAQQTES